MAQGQVDPLLIEIAEYVLAEQDHSDAAWESASLCLMDALGCAIAALDDPDCARHVTPIVPGAVLSDGAQVVGTALTLDPVRAAHANGCLIRWLDFNDTWLAQEWGHPSDNLGAILACADARDSGAVSDQDPVSVREILDALIKAYEIQGLLSMAVSFNRRGLDHVILVRIASVAVAALLLGADREVMINALSNGFMDGGMLRAYRHAPNTGWRKSWAAGDATARGVWHAVQARAGEMGYPQVLTTPRYGFEAVFLDGEPLGWPRTPGSFVVENILFKAIHPTEFHAQTAIECAILLHDEAPDLFAGRLDEIERIELTTTEPAIRIIHKTGSLQGPADRDHCLQYIVAVGLIYGELNAGHYHAAVAADPRLDLLRDKMTVREDPVFTRDYYASDKRAIGNGITVRLTSGEVMRRSLDYPLGHKCRRVEALPHLLTKFKGNLARRYEPQEIENISAMLLDFQHLSSLMTADLMELFHPREVARQPEKAATW